MRGGKSATAAGLASFDQLQTGLITVVLGAAFLVLLVVGVRALWAWVINAAVLSWNAKQQNGNEDDSSDDEGSSSSSSSDEEEGDSAEQEKKKKKKKKSGDTRRRHGKAKQ